MKKSILVTLILGLVAGSFAMTAEAAQKKKKPKRVEEVVELEYTGGDIGVTAPATRASTCFVDPAMPFACKSIPSPGSEFTYVKIEVADATGQNAAGFLAQQDADGDGFNDPYGEFCGAHEAPIPLEVPGAPVGLSITMGLCDNGTPSIVTSGTITATFSNLP